MKKFLTAMAAFIMMNTSAYAVQYSYGDVVSVIENWQYQQTRVPYEDCTTVRVPTTSNRNSAGGDALAGMIIGGLLGKGITGNDKGAAAGAVLGGVIGADKSRPKPRQQYREEYRCVTKYNTSNEPVQVGYNVQYMYDGHLYEFHTFKRYRNGDKIKLEVRVRPLN